MKTLIHDRTGSGPPLILLHGFPFDARMWEAQRVALARIFTVVTPDLLGFGRSKDVGAATDLRQQADAVLALATELQFPRFILGGLSMGGYIALAVAEKAAGRLQGLILADTRANPDTEEGKAGRLKSIELVKEKGPGTLTEGLLPKLLAPGAAPSAVALIRDMIASQTTEGVCNALLAMRDRPDRGKALHSAQVPVLGLVGALDVMTPPHDMQSMLQGLARAQLVTLPGAAHVSNLEQPAAFNQAIERWWKGQSGS